MLDIFAFLLLGAATFAAFNLDQPHRSRRSAARSGSGWRSASPARARPPPVAARRRRSRSLGVALGIPVGLAADAWLRSVMQDQFFPLPVLTTPASRPACTSRAPRSGWRCPLLATALPVWRALRVTPIEAIRVGARAARSSGLAWLLKGVRVPGGSLANLPLRNVLRTPRRTLMTLLGIGAVVTIVVALAGRHGLLRHDARRQPQRGAGRRASSA